MTLKDQLPRKKGCTTCLKYRRPDEQSALERFGFIGVLKTLEEAARMANASTHNFDELFGLGENWSAGQNPELRRRASLQTDKLMDASTFSRLFTSAFEIDVIIKMLRALLGKAFQFQKEYKHILDPIIAQNSRGGLLSLPDEVLQEIFKISVYAQGRRGRKQAIWLSHISQRLRSASLEEPELWTVLSSEASAEELEAFSARGGNDKDIRVFFHAKPNFCIDQMEPFAKYCRRLCHRAKQVFVSQEGIKYEVNVDHDYEWGTTSYTKIARGHDLANAFLHKLEDTLTVLLPHLQRLDTCSEDVDSEMQSFRQWFDLSGGAPNLRFLACERFLLSGEPSSVTTFAFKAHIGISRGVYKGIDFVRSLIDFLPGMPCLDRFDFDVNFNSFDHNTPRWDNKIHPIFLPSFSLTNVRCDELKSFHLRLHPFNFRLAPLASVELFVAKFLEALVMPKLHTLLVSIGLQPGSHTGYNADWDAALGCLSHALLAGVVDSLQILEYKIFHEGDTNDSYYTSAGDGPLANHPVNLPIPVDNLLSCSKDLYVSLSIPSPIQVIFTRDIPPIFTLPKGRHVNIYEVSEEDLLVFRSGKSSQGESDKMAMEFIQAMRRRREKFERDADGNIEKPDVGTLRHISFADCEGMTLENFGSTIESLEAVGVWESLEVVSVNLEYGSTLSYEDVRGIVGEKEMRFLR